MKKSKDLFFIGVMYLIAYLAAIYFTRFATNEILNYFIFDAVATVIIFFFSVLMTNSSVYDPYWSLTPLVMSLWLFVEKRAFSLMQLAFLIAFNFWAARLTINWITVFTDFSYEDWRYKKFRDETHKLLWPIVNFAGIHMMPTLVVFAGMLPLFVIASEGIGIWAIPGIMVMVTGVLFEHFADTAMHRFLAESTDKKVCRLGLWKYSRHPNYLGEITFWFGVFIAMIPYAPDRWHYCIGCVSVAILFNTVSIPLMEKRQMSRRPDYAKYKSETSRLLLLPRKNK